MSSEAPTLRPYQRAAIEAVVTARKRGVRRMVVCLPTGAGKTVIFSQLARLAKRQVLVLAHREELLSQAEEKIQKALGESGLVAVEQGEKRARKDAKVVVSSIRSLHERRLAEVMKERDFGLVVYDECHHAAAEDNMRVLRSLGAFDPSWTGTLLGFTATTARGDGIGLEKVFQEIVYSRSLPEMIHDGYLAPLRGFRIETAADLTRLSDGASDFREEELAEAVDIEERNALVARSIQELSRDRRTIVFCVTVGHAKNLARALGILGVPAGVVYGDMPSEQRKDVLARFREGRLSAITNVGVLTEGFDDPGVSCVAMARPTRSEGLYAQCVGRGTRLFPGKRDCLILDFVDVSKLSLATLPSLFGMPRDLDLRGEDVAEAQKAWARITLDAPGFEVEAGAITLSEIKDRAASFDPLAMRVDPEIVAISGNAWESLGRHGLALHFEKKPGVLCEVLVLIAGQRGKKWQVTLDGAAKERFSTLEEAVQAVDYEVDRRGRAVAASARHKAAWRLAPTPAALMATLPVGKNGRRPATMGEAMRRVVWERVVGKGKGKGKGNGNGKKG